MGVEIERKFLLRDDSWKTEVVRSYDITQGYLSTDPARTVRIRKRGDEAFLTIKGQPQTSDGAPMVPEFEYAIPAGDADALMALCLPGAIVKTRHIVMHDGNTWEIDVFQGDNAGLIVAEIELASAAQAVTLPAWIGQEVTGQVRYSNAQLAQNPYKLWKNTPPPAAPGRVS